MDCRDLGVVNRILMAAWAWRTGNIRSQTEVACGLQEDISIKLADGFGAPISMPAFASVDDESVDYQEHVRLPKTVRWTVRAN